MTGARGASVHYRVEAADLHAHLFRVTLSIDNPSAQQKLSLPVWIPGSYLVREFSRHLQKIVARQDGRAVPLAQLDKCSWQAECVPGTPLLISYEAYAWDNSVRAAWLDAQRGFFNGTSLCLRAHGQEHRVHSLELVADATMAGWQVATGLAPWKVGKRGFGTYLAADYDELVDCPVEMGSFWSAEFRVAGVPHRLVVAGAPESFDGARLLADVHRICETEIRFWHERRKPPFKSYVFMLNLVDDGYGGLEHRNSTALIASRRDVPRLGESRMAEGYVTLLGLISHEYFHTWNVKRLRPAEFAEYDYAGENYTQLLWFFEGFTSYYDDLLLRRAGLIDEPTYLRLLNKTINQVMQTPGREVQSVAQASFDAWVKYYRQDENTPNATVSYYTKGALVALCFDLALRAEGQATLDDVMRALWTRCKAGPMGEADFAAVLKDVGGRAFTRELAAWVHGTRELPLEDLLRQQGVEVLHEPAQWQQRLGLRVTESGGSVTLKTVLRGGAAEQAGMAAGDEWLGIEVGGQGWRLSKMDDLPLYAGTHRKLVALVARDRRLLRLDLTLPASSITWRLVLRDAARAQPWLAANA
ncbi:MULTISPECIES: M61 family metallopeptidase [Ramlibacter]|uniref:M61 family metallopeptidase n=1 Tax=Ramlibacter aquaticus TaxID=2780094 RepID=A0ABR9SB54_9BURK|nr:MULTISPECIES: M61 family metallopeptidase [Ramlibacter]MBE7939464.1 M61 family metallopeptidase [Ramlibacter aquaticus]